MKKILTALMLALVILCCTVCAAGEAKRDQLEISMEMSGFRNTDKTVEAGDTIQVTFRFTNTSGADFAGRMFLFDPAKKRVGEFPLLKDGESAEWNGELTVTEEMVRDGKVTYRLQFSYFDENGETVRVAKNLNKKINAASKKAVSEYAPIFLYCVYDRSETDGKIGVYCIDEAGLIWRSAEADLKPGYSEEELLQLLQERRGMTRRTETLLSTAYGVHSEEWIKELAQRAASVPAAEGTPEETGVNTDETAIYALKNKKDGSTESVLLGMSGRRLFENTDPDAQALYQFMWMQLYWEAETFSPSYGFAAEGIAPYGFRTVSVREFFGLEKADAATVVITAVENDCEEGLKEAPVTEKDREWALAMLERGIITRKANGQSVTGGTESYLFHTADGEYLGCIELYKGLAVKNDGMYQMSLPTVSTENLPEEEQRLLTLRIDGFDYQLGKTTPREIIRDGWKCRLSDYNFFSMENADGTKKFSVHTAGGSLDEPVYLINPSVYPGAAPEYCGFDGYMDPENPEDPDRVWWEKAREAGKANGEDEDYDPPYGGIYYWLSTGALGEVYQAPDYLGGEVTVDVTLSDGRQLEIHLTEWQPVNLVLREADGEGADMD